MAGYAGREFTLSEVLEGSTLRAHLLSQWRQDQYDPDKKPAELEPVDCPTEVMYLWDYFKDMSSRRTNNGFRDNPIPHEGVEAWARRRGITLEPFEHLLIDAVEEVYLRIKNTAKEKS